MLLTSRSFMLVFLLAPSQVFAQDLGSGTALYPTGVDYSDADQRITIRELATVKARPDTLYLLMKLQNEGALLDQAIDQNKKALDGFVGALRQLPIEPSAIRLSNFVVTPTMMRTGATFARNVVIEIPDIDRKPDAEINKLIAQVQDLGARFGSHCITCIGSG